MTGHESYWLFMMAYATPGFNVDFTIIKHKRASGYALLCYNDKVP